MVKHPPSPKRTAALINALKIVEKRLEDVTVVVVAGSVKSSEFMVIDFTHAPAAPGIVSVSSFSGGKYLVWRVKGNVEIDISSSTGTNAVVSGLFLDGPVSQAQVTFVTRDTSTEGTWVEIRLDRAHTTNARVTAPEAG